MPKHDGGRIGFECDVAGCDGDIVGLEDGWEYERGTVCQDCIDYRDRHGHWPDQQPEICVECRIDDGAINHDCDESAADGVLVQPGDGCPFCEFEAAIGDGGVEQPNGGNDNAPTLGEAMAGADFVAAEPLPTPPELDDAECHNCGHPWGGGDEWTERYLTHGPAVGETWMFECPNCEEETFECGT